MNAFKRILLLTLSLLCVCTGAQGASPYIVFVFDASGSMSGRKLDQAKTALSRSLTLLPTDTQVGLIVFSDTSEWVYKPGPLDLQRLSALIRQISIAGGTALGDALSLATDELVRIERAKTNQGDASTYQIVALTDGENMSGRDPVQVIPLVARRHQRIDVIGIEMKDKTLIRALKDNGFKNSYHMADRVDDLFIVLQKVLNLEDLGMNTQGTNAFEVLAPIEPEMAMALINTVVHAQKLAGMQDLSEGPEDSEPREPSPGSGCQVIPGSAEAHPVRDLLGGILYLVLLVGMVFVVLKYSPGPRVRSKDKERD